MTQRGWRSLLVVAAALSASGCKLFDGGVDVSLVLVGPAMTQGKFALRAEARSAAKIRLVVDGTELDLEVPSGQVTEADLTQFADGPHLVRARAFDGDLQRDSAPVQVVLDRTGPVATLSPPPGEQYAMPIQPFVIKLEFDDPIDPASVGPSTVKLTNQSSRGWVATPAEITLAADLRHLRVVAAPLPELKDAVLDLSIRNLVGLQIGSGYWSARWTHRPVYVERIVPPPISPGSTPPETWGVLGIRVKWWNPERVPFVEAFMDGALIGKLQSDVPFDWDSNSVADGPHTLTFLAEGVPAGSADLRVMNAPPRLLSCTARFATPPDASTLDGFNILFDREVCVGSVYDHGCNSYLPGGPGNVGTDGYTLYSDGYSTAYRWWPGAAGPGTYQLSFASARSHAGKLPVGNTDCTVTLPVWRAPWGDTLPAELGSSEFALLDTVQSTQGGTAGSFLRIAPAGSPIPGAAETWASMAPLPWSVTIGTQNGTPFLPAEQLRSDGHVTLWLEAGADGGVRIRGIPEVMWSDSAETITTLPASVGPVELPRGGIGWIQTGASGKRELHAAYQNAFIFPWFFTEPANVNPQADVTEAVMLPYRPVAFVERSPAAPGQLRVRRYGLEEGSGWTSVGDVLNRDPLVRASEPSLVGDGYFGGLPFVVAWTEGGQVLVRTWSGPGPWSDPVVLNADPSAPARWPYVFFTMGSIGALFVENGAGGDRFELRRFDSATWTWKSLPSLSAGGEVTWMSLAALLWFSQPASYPYLVWKDPAGVAHLRVYNP